MISVKNVTLSFGKRILFDEVNLNFAKGNCYGVIGANGAGKSTFLKILSGEIEPNKGTVEITPGERMAVLKQDQFEFDEFSVLNTVLKGHDKLWEVMQEREIIYGKEDFTEADGMQAAHLEAEFGEMGGYEAESNAGSLLNNLGVHDSFHQSLMKDIPSNLKLRVLLAQALFGNPDILLLDEPTNGLDPNQIIEIRGLVKEIAEQRTVILSTHILSEVQATCDYIRMIAVKIIPHSPDIGDEMVGGAGRDHQPRAALQLVRDVVNVRRPAHECIVGIILHEDLGRRRGVRRPFEINVARIDTRVDQERHN